MISRLAIAGYRSLRDVRLALGRLTVVTGANGSGKSSLYRGLRLLADVAQGRVVASLAAEGGFSSTLWAGPATLSAAMRRGEQPVQGTVRKHPVGLKLGFSGADFGYAIDLGLPPPPGGPTPSAFGRDPEIKAESLWLGERLAPSTVIAARNAGRVRIRGEAGEWQVAADDLATFDSMMTQCGDPRSAPELLVLRERMRDWRFYDQWRTDRDAPPRQPQVGTYTPVLAGDGRDLAAAVQTIVEIGDAQAFAEAITDAFPGAAVSVRALEGRFELAMSQPGLLRPLAASELSEGTLRYLMLAAALLSPRPPALLVLNEPEASLHPDLLPPLARLIARAARRTQVLVVSHAPDLVARLAATREGVVLTLEKRLGETVIDGDAPPPAWSWPAR